MTLSHFRMVLKQRIIVQIKTNVFFSNIPVHTVHWNIGETPAYFSQTRQMRLARRHINKFPRYNGDRLKAFSIAPALLAAASWCPNICPGISGAIEHLGLT